MNEITTEPEIDDIDILKQYSAITYFTNSKETKLIKEIDFIRPSKIVLHIKTQKKFIYVRAVKDSPSVVISWDKLNEFRKTREKSVIGYSMSNKKPLEIYEDGDFFHIGCEKVEKQKFLKEFINIKNNIKTENEQNKLSAATTDSNNSANSRSEN